MGFLHTTTRRKRKRKMIFVTVYTKRARRRVDRTFMYLQRARDIVNAINVDEKRTAQRLTLGLYSFQVKPFEVVAADSLLVMQAERPERGPHDTFTS